MKPIYYILALLLFPSVALAQPANNDCESAILLSFTNTCLYSTYSNAGATFSGDATATCGGTPTTDVWFKFVVPSSGNIAINTVRINFYSAMAIYTGRCDSLSLYRCDDNSNSSYLMPYIEFHDSSLAGDTLYLQYWGNNADTGSFKLCVHEPDQPVNTNCSNAYSLTVQNDFNYSSYTTAHAGGSNVADPSCGNYITDDVWFTTTVPSSGKLIIRTENINISNPAIAVYTGTCGSLQSYACNDNGAPGYLQAQIYIDDTALVNQDIKIRVWKVNSIFGGQFKICAMEPQLDSNNTIEGASFLEVESDCNYKRFNASNYTNSGKVTPSCGNYVGADIWFKTVVPASGRLALSIRDVNTGNTVMAIYTGTLDSLTQYQCVDGNAPYYLQPEAIIRDSSIAGDTIYIMVWEYNSVFPASFDICCFEPEIPSNAECVNAQTLVVKPSCNLESFSNEYAGTSGDALPTCDNYDGTDVWFKFEVPQGGEFTVNTRAISSDNFGLSLYTGTCGSLTEYECSANSSTFNTNMPRVSILDSSLSGQIVYVQMWRTGSVNGTPFQICVFGNLSPEVRNPRSATICEGQDTPTLSVQNGVFQYNWYSQKTGGTLLASDTNRYRPTAAGTFWVEAVHPENFSKSERVALSLTVNTRPLLVNALDKEFCEGADPVPLSVDDLGQTYNWYSDSTMQNIVALDTNKYQPINSAIFYVQAVNSNTNCRSQLKELRMSIHRKPLIANALNRVACENSLPIELKVDDLDDIYNWYASPNLSNLLASNSATYSTSQAGTYYIQATDSASSCKSDIDSIVLSVYSNPVIVKGLKKELCMSDTPTKIGIVDQGDIYNWYGTRNGTNTIALNTPNIESRVSGTFYVQATDPITNCKSSIDSVLLVFHRNPLVVNPQSYIGCDDQNYNGLSVDDLGDTYNWYNSETNGTAMAVNTAIYNASLNGDYYVEAIDESTSCKSLVREKVSLLIYPEVSPLIAYDGDSLHTTTFNSYQWFKNDIAIFGANSMSYEILTSGVYHVEVIDSNGCSHKSNTVNIESSLGLNQLVDHTIIQVYPNPFESTIQIKVDQRFLGAEASLMNSNGQILMQFTCNINKLSLNLSELEAGIYFINFTNNKGSLTKRIIKL